jgi:hypothetical protein
MTIFLTLLKIIGWVLLIALLLIFLLLILLLFAPVTYQAVGSIHEKQVAGHVRVSWLFCLVNFHIRYEKNDMKMYLRLFGFRKWLMKSEKEDLSGEDDMSELHISNQNDSQETNHLGDESSSGNPGFGNDNGVITDEPNGDSFALTDHAEETSDKPNDIGENYAEDESDAPKKDTIVQKIRRKWKSLTEKIKNIKKSIRKISQMLEDPVNKDAISHLKRAVSTLLKCIMPSKLKLKLSYSTGSPDTTAQVFGILAMFPIGYTNRWNINPDFEAEEAYADGDMDIKGYFFIVQILILLLGVLFDKKCRRFYHRLKK